MKAFIRYSCTLLVGVIFSGIFSVSIAFTQITDTTGTSSGLRGSPRVYKYSTRTAALADANIADTFDPSLININPASLSFVNNLKQVQINIFQNWNNNLMYENLTVPGFRYRNHTVTGQLSFFHEGANSTNYLGRNPKPQPDLNSYQVDIAYAYSFENVLSLGVMTNVSFTNNDFAQIWTSHVSIGLIYAPSRSISYGIAFRGLGNSPIYRLITTSENIRRTALWSQNLREVLELGATLQFPVDTENSYLSFSLANEKRFGEEGIWYKAGLEITKISFLALRSGILFHPENNVYAPRFGLGIKNKFFVLDYAVSYQDKLYERYHQVAITIPLNF